ncbi:GTP 3',8-cyclase MoaA [Maritalea porphyrae]|nr:GTP 3',8-cyclase MoaA [Maritalea porphyrae]
MIKPSNSNRPLIDNFGRHVEYLRISVTDRCDFRCTYCMSENMSFLPKSQVLSLEEIEQIASVFIARGVKKLRLTGGEPLVRRDIMTLVQRLGAHLGNGLEELTLTTNGSQLRRHATALAESGVRRVNVSLDTRDAAKFAEITRWGRLSQVLDGIDAALEAGLKVKINMVALKGENDHEIAPMLEWAHSKGMDLTLIETMPMGAVDIERADQYLPLSTVQEELSQSYTLHDDLHKTGGPARYLRIEETGGRLGLITPLTHNFCEGCNRVRMTATGDLYLCLGQDDMVRLRDPLREGGVEAVDKLLDHAMDIKPKGHDFEIDRKKPQRSVSRHMSVTGG